MKLWNLLCLTVLSQIINSRKLIAEGSRWGVRTISQRPSVGIYPLELCPVNDFKISKIYGV